MALTSDDFDRGLADLRATLDEQGERVRDQVERGLDSFFGRDHDLAKRVIDGDDEIDQTDVELEKRAIALLAQAAREAVPLQEGPLLGILGVVKVNNELERIADTAVEIARRTLALTEGPAVFPPTTRVMTNSTLGIVRDVCRAFAGRDAGLARTVLESQDAVLAFKAEILRQAEQLVADGQMSVDTAFDLHELASQCTLMADHASNIAEQLVYELTGVIVRHTESGWVGLE